MISSISTATLGKLAAVGSAALSVTGTILYYCYQNRLRQTQNYKRAMEIFYDHPKAVYHLGRPISEGKLTINDSETDVVSFTVALKGANTKGELYCEVQKSYDPAVFPELKKVEIKFQDTPNKTFVIMNNW